jgi:RimJ/RimL family protein N-acetyltransferase
VQKVSLRAFEPGDYKLINQWRNDDEITDLLGGNKIYVSAERERKWVEEKIMGSPTEQFLAICLSDEPFEMVGYLSIIHIEWRNRQAEWGGIIIGRKDFRSKGIGTQAAELMLQFAFSELNLNRLYGHWLVENTPSLKMATKLSFQHEGVLRQAVFKHGAYHDVAVLAILQSDYLQRTKMA